MNEDQYYSPIIQAMVHTATLQKQGQQQEIEKERNKNEAAARQEGLKQAQQTIDQNHENQLRQHDLALQQLELQHQHENLQAELSRFNATKTLQEILGGAKPGFDIGKIAPGITKFLQGGGQQQVQTQQQPQVDDPFLKTDMGDYISKAKNAGKSMSEIGQNLIGAGWNQQEVLDGLNHYQDITSQPQPNQQIPPAAPAVSGENPMAGLFDPEAKARQIGAETTAKAGAEEPFKIREEDRANTNKLALLGAQKDADKEIARIHGAYQLSGDRINGAYHLQGIQLMHQLGLDDGSGSNAGIAKSLLDGIFNGNEDFSKLTPDQKRAVTGYAQGTGELSSIPSDGKSYKAKLDSVTGIQTMLSQYKDLAANFSRDSQGVWDRGNQNITLPLVGTIQRTAPGSDLESKIAAMKSSGGQLATFFDQQNRKSDAEIIRQVMGEFDPKATAKQNMDKLNTHIKQLENAVKQNFVGMNPDRINTILGNRGITDLGAFSGTDKPDWLKVAPKTNKSGHTLDEEMSIKMNKPVYK